MTEVLLGIIALGVVILTVIALAVAIFAYKAISRVKSLSKRAQRSALGSWMLYRLWRMRR